MSSDLFTWYGISVTTMSNWRLFFFSTISAFARVMIAAASGDIRFFDRLRVIDDAAGREIRPFHELQKVLARGVAVVGKIKDGVGDLAQVVRGNARRHADGDAERAVQKKVRQLRGKHGRLVARAVVVRDPIHRFLLNVRRASRSRSRRAWLRYNAWRPAGRRPPNRSSPARARADSARKSPAPCAPSCHI